MKQLLIIFGAYFILMATWGQPRIQNPSGDVELDQIRLEINSSPTKRENFKLRAIKMKLWAASLQQQGIHLADYVNVDNRLNKITRWNNLWSGNKPQVFSTEEMNKACIVIDDGYAVLEIYQKIASNGSSLAFKSNATPINSEIQNEVPWTSYKGNEGLSGYTGALGPTKGEKAWTFPVGLAWESKPAIEGNRVYISSPGIRTTMYCLDLNTGEVIWSTKQLIEIMGDQLYHASNNQSSPVILKDHILFREMGARGNRGPTKDVVLVDKKTGEIVKEIEVGHVDYRAGHAPFTANEDIVVYPFGVQDIHDKPPVTQAFDRVIAKEIKTGRKLFEMYTGYTFAEPLLDDEGWAYQGTLEGYLYAWKANRKLGHRPKPNWTFRAEGAINDKAVVYGNFVLFGANDGTFYCLNKRSGVLQWEYSVENVEHRSYRHFSAPFVADGKVAVGAADKNFYVFDIETGEEYGWEDVLIFEEGLSDNEKKYLVDSISKTPLIREAIFLFSKGNLVRLSNILARGVWISKKGDEENATIFRVSIQTRHQGSFDILLKKNKNRESTEIKDEVNWLILAGSRYFMAELQKSKSGFFTIKIAKGRIVCTRNSIRWPQVCPWR